jgi:hypothetical protein
MSLTALLTLMGGAGTSCVALDPTGFGDRFAGIAPFQWLYILFVVVTLAIGVIGVRTVVGLVRGRKDSYRDSLITLAAGTVVGVAHIAASRLLRGGSMPVDVVVYTTIVTLVVFLLFRAPGIRQRVDFETPEGGSGIAPHAATIALAACGALALTIQFPMAPTHTIAGLNYADSWHWAMTILGFVLILAAWAQYEITIARRDPTPVRRPHAPDA